jgi:hypothetical protein
MNKTNTDRKDAVNDSCNVQSHHEHQHGATCGHKAIPHGDHIDYVHDGHLHRIHGKHVDECEGGASEPTKP